jgi:trehalose 6-phosphate phosphatase
MRQILARRHRQTLANFTASNVLVGFDFDGTLAAIAERPELARMRARTRRLLTAVTRRYPVVVIAGRARQDVARCLGSVPVWEVVGNDGLEPWADRLQYLDEVREWALRLRRALARHAGVVIENKRYSLTVHYRHARPLAPAVAAIRRAIGELHGARAIDGIAAISVSPRGAPDKGAALERARRLLCCDAAIYVGDDGSDEPVFAAGDPDRHLAIRVGHDPRSRAAYFLRSQAEVDDLLHTLVALRPIRRLSQQDGIGA